VGRSASCDEVVSCAMGFLWAWMASWTVGPAIGLMRGARRIGVGVVRRGAAASLEGVLGGGQGGVEGGGRTGWAHGKMSVCQLGGFGGPDAAGLWSGRGSQPVALVSV